MAAAVDVVLLDCFLPGGTMWQIVLEADRQNVPVVLMTGDPAQMKDAGAGTRPYIFKPFTLAALKGVLEDAAQRRAPSDTLAGDTPACVGRPPFRVRTWHVPHALSARRAGGLRFSAQGIAKAQ